MFIPHRQAVKNLTVMLPFWHELIHQFNKVRAVRWFQQVDHLMRDNVIQAFPGLLGEFRIQAYRPGAGIAATPPGFHPLHKTPLHLHPQ